MRAINHSLTGAIIGLTVANPAAAVLMAVASHYVLDVIPHSGDKGHELKRLKSRWFAWALVADAVLCAALVLLLAVKQPLHWQLASLCAFAAAAPDLLSFNRFWKVKKGQDWQPSSYSRFAMRIQWFERPIGSIVEVIWFVAGTVILLPLLNIK